MTCGAQGPAHRLAYIFGAICHALGKGTGLVIPRCTTEAMALHLDEIAQAAAPGARAVLLLEPAGWHTTKKFRVPANIALLTLLARSPELNPVENLWQFMRDNRLGSRDFKSYADILNHCCHAWNSLINRPCRIMSIELPEWAYGC
ncbi:putative transposase (plasmid) [Methylobacterium radiotolerans JCM 2831]|uniref:Putative transposase n=1 Tax=Methylobacterium radiotolerans (strain ATCC 27329 / DSM 1819 / JCM 2831 / NBRC 15690 / NCIMB 10815 / 0-1) TaxID=426355 RepID=B1M985_METRJ|nr:putative transposase [Methylobacterium radiotolerans JCM 2831]GEN01790.1 hypothetical protein MRA01_63290 [Methylobacterium radiotolerans]